ncbi:hypothetical protein [Halobaculum halobium]|uniref:Uncharacterized protein n=1 Tax=Halobaculum halobium TaxID=3032281 RepID=A0ABD5T6P7_9EURY|nr:hypothetical protein [Halobaculum sp. SYNS20]
MNTPDGASSRSPRDPVPELPRANVRTAVVHTGCSVVGLTVTVAIAVLFYAELVAAVELLQVHLLTSTALVFLFIWLWGGVWVVAEVLWAWRTEPPAGSR